MGPPEKDCDMMSSDAGRALEYVKNHALYDSAIEVLVSSSIDSNGHFTVKCADGSDFAKVEGAPTIAKVRPSLCPALSRTLAKLGPLVQLSGGCGADGVPVTDPGADVLQAWVDLYTAEVPFPFPLPFPVSSRGTGPGAAGGRGHLRADLLLHSPRPRRPLTNQSMLLCPPAIPNNTS